MKRCFAFLLAFVMMLSLCVSLGSFSALADEEPAAATEEPAEVPEEPTEEPEEHEHDWIKATCTEPKTCSICGATEGEAKGHKVEEWKTTVKATCTEGGEKSGVCTRCGETVTKATDPKGHKAGEKWKTIQEPTSYDRTLIRIKKCERCGEECKRQEKTLSKKEFRSWYKDNCKSISYDKLDRKPDKYDGRKIKFTGYVLQICNEANSYGYGIGNTNQYRVATKGRWNDVIYVYIYGKLDERIREGDKITLWGEYDGLMSYYTGFGVKITIPSMIAEYYSIK